MLSPSDLVPDTFMDEEEEEFDNEKDAGQFEAHLPVAKKPMGHEHGDSERNTLPADTFDKRPAKFAGIFHYFLSKRNVCPDGLRTQSVHTFNLTASKRLSSLLNNWRTVASTAN